MDTGYWHTDSKSVTDGFSWRTTCLIRISRQNTLPSEFLLTGTNFSSNRSGRKIYLESCLRNYNFVYENIVPERKNRNEMKLNPIRIQTDWKHKAYCCGNSSHLVKLHFSFRFNSVFSVSTTLPDIMSWHFSIYNSKIILNRKPVPSISTFY